ncbi:MAG: pirin-like C-terminal cupin domain-containing protein, partial [Pseudomonadota bacterium]
AAFIHHGETALPRIQDGKLDMRLIAGALHGAASPLKTASETLYADIALAAGGRYQVEASHEERALYVLAGPIAVEEKTYEPGTLLILSRAQSVLVEAKGDARLMLFGGEPMEGPRYIWWNFVSSRPERIEAAKQEWRQGRFDTVPGDEEEFIPLPEDNTKPRRALGGRAFS